MNTTTTGRCFVGFRDGLTRFTQPPTGAYYGGLAPWLLGVGPHDGTSSFPAQSLAAALVVIALWMLAAVGLGAWRTVTRDA